jgi:hypothetical protein
MMSRVGRRLIIVKSNVLVTRSAASGANSKDACLRQKSAESESAKSRHSLHNLLLQLRYKSA